MMLNSNKMAHRKPYIL